MLFSGEDSDFQKWDSTRACPSSSPQGPVLGPHLPSARLALAQQLGVPAPPPTPGPSAAPHRQPGGRGDAGRSGCLHLWSSDGEKLRSHGVCPLPPLHVCVTSGTTSGFEYLERW